MIKYHIKLTIRNLVNSKAYSFINIAGLAVGLTVVMIIGIWIRDELSYNTTIPGFKNIVQVLQNQNNNGSIQTQEAVPPVLADGIRKWYGDDFKYVVQTSWNNDFLLTYEKKHFNKEGVYAEDELLDLLSVEMLDGSEDALDDPYSILISATLARTIFGNRDPLNKTIKINNYQDLKIGGVFKDLPENTDFARVHFIIPWKLFLLNNPYIATTNSWGSNYTRAFAMIHPGADYKGISEKIKNIIYQNVDEANKKTKAEIFLHPMDQWHLYNDFEYGKNTGGRIKYIWLFGIIGGFVLLLACINFMNLATARSSKRAREVGIFKTLGSNRGQLIRQFLAESAAVVFLALILSLVLTQFAFPYFNEIAGKNLSIPWNHSVFWLALIAFALIVSLLAGSYPAFYLSSFIPVEVLSGSRSAGKSAALPRKVLVIFQFTVSVFLLACTWVVYRQIQYAKDRPVGFNTSQLITTGFYGGIYRSFEAFTNELKTSGAVSQVAQSTSPPASVWRTNSRFNWKGKDPNFSVDFPNNAVSFEYGKTIGWQLIKGRDFSRDIISDSSAMIITAKTAQMMDLDDPIGETITWNDRPYTLVGIVDNIMVGSPYSADITCVYHIADEQENVINIRLSDRISTQEALSRIQAIYKKYAPEVPFEYTFIDLDVAKKFNDEERIGKLSSWFTYMAMFISILGLLGLAAYTAEKRTKEIGIRKVLGASVLGICRMMTKEFLVLTTISFLIAIPLSYFMMHRWLENFDYRTTISIDMYMIIGIVTLLVTITIVGIQSLKAAWMNPVRSLRSE